MGSIDFSDLEPTSPPPPGYKPELVVAAQRADAILAEHGSVGDPAVYGRKHEARYRAQRMIELLAQQGLRKRWELRERTWRELTGWRWSVKLERGGDDA